MNNLFSFKNHRYDGREAAISQVVSRMKTKYQFDKVSNNLKYMKKN